MSLLVPLRAHLAAATAAAATDVAADAADELAATTNVADDADANSRDKAKRARTDGPEEPGPAASPSDAELAKQLKNLEREFDCLRWAKDASDATIAALKKL